MTLLRWLDRIGLDHTAELLVLTDGVDAIINSLNSPNKVLGYSRVDNRLGIGALHTPNHLGVGNMELVLNLGCKYIPVGLYVLLYIVRYGNHELTIAWDGVVQLTTVELSQLDALVTVHLLIQETSEDLDGVSALLVDIIT